MSHVPSAPGRQPSSRKVSRHIQDDTTTPPTHRHAVLSPAQPAKAALVYPPTSAVYAPATHHLRGAMGCGDPVSVAKGLGEFGAGQDGLYAE
jgi:hypothetical protein